MKTIRFRLIIVIASWLAGSVLASPDTNVREAMTAVMERIKVTVTGDDIDAAVVACNEAKQWLREDQHRGPLGLARREELEFQFEIVERIAGGIETNREKELIFLNMAAPPEAIQDPVARAEYERRFADNKRRANRHRKNEILTYLKEEWSKEISDYVSANYSRSKAAIEEIEDSLSSTVQNEQLQEELRELLKIPRK